MELKEIIPESEDWVTQKVLYAYYGTIRLGSLMAAMGENNNAIYGYEINGRTKPLPDGCKTWKEAENVFLEIMFDYFDDQEGYYNELKHMCNELIQETA